MKLFSHVLTNTSLRSRKASFLDDVLLEEENIVGNGVEVDADGDDII